MVKYIFQNNSFGVFTMKSNKYLSRLPVVTSFILSVASLGAFADNHGSDHRGTVDDGSKAYTVKDKPDNLTGPDKPVRKLGHKQPKNASDSNGRKSDTSTMGKETSAESTVPDRN